MSDCKCIGYPLTANTYHMTWCPAYKPPVLDVNPLTYFKLYGERYKIERPS